MKIVHIQQYYNDGYGYQENILPSYQHELGNEVVLLTSKMSQGFNGENRHHQEGTYEDDGFLIRRLKTRFEFKDRFVVFDNLFKEIEGEKPNLIFHHSATTPSIFTLRKYKKKYPNVKIAVDNHADTIISGRNMLWRMLYYNFFWKICLKFVERYVDVFFGVTPLRCEFLIHELGITREKVRLLPIGADTKKIEDAKNSSWSLRESLNLTDEIIICSGGKMGLLKNTDTLIRAFKRIKDQNVRLVLFGSFSDKGLEDLIQGDERIIFLGWKNRIDTLMILTQCDLGVWNGQHTTLIEDAVGCELPVVLKKYGSTEHLINGNGVFLDTNEENELYNVLFDILVNNRILELKENTRKMRDYLSYDNIAKESIDF